MGCRNHSPGAISVQNSVLSCYRSNFCNPLKNFLFCTQVRGRGTSSLQLKRAGGLDIAGARARMCVCVCVCASARAHVRAYVLNNPLWFHCDDRTDSL